MTGIIGLKRMKGWISRVHNIARWNPNELFIVGGPDPQIDIPYSDSYAAFYCPRAAEPVSEEFVETIREPNRVYETVSVLHLGRGEDSMLVVVAGRRRVKAARLIWNEQEAAGVPERWRVIVLVQLHKYMTPEMIWQLNVCENSTKRSLTPAQQAMQDAHLIARKGEGGLSIGHQPSEGDLDQPPGPGVRRDTDSQESLEEHLQMVRPSAIARDMERLARFYEEKTPSRRGGDRRSAAYRQRRDEGVADGDGAVERIARLVGKDARTVRRMIRIARYGVPQLLAALDKGLHQNVAERIARLPAAEQEAEVKRQLDLRH